MIEPPVVMSGSGGNLRLQVATKKKQPGAEETPLRADARLNRERILAAAEEVFLERGADVSLEDVAKRAKVGSARSIVASRRERRSSRRCTANVSWPSPKRVARGTRSSLRASRCARTWRSS
jgi:hypothetical protein